MDVFYLRTICKCIIGEIGKWLDESMYELQLHGGY